MKRSAVVLAVACLLFPSVGLAASASLYKCNEAGKVVYSDRPCTGDRNEGKVTLAIPELGPQGSRDLARAKRRLDGEERVADSRKTTLESGRVVPDMTEAEVTALLGSPDAIRYINGYVQWCYDGPQRTNPTYVYFKNGRTRGSN